MIGNPKWFKYRIFGWGIAPKTWQGWAYIAVAAFVIAGTMAMPMNNVLKAWIFGIVLGIFFLDVLHIMMQLPKTTDERENYHQLIIERNCSFAAIVALLGIAMYQAYQNNAFFAKNVNLAVPFDMTILVVLGAMLFVKIASTLYVRAKM